MIARRAHATGGGKRWTDQYSPPAYAGNLRAQDPESQLFHLETPFRSGLECHINSFSLETAVETLTTFLARSAYTMEPYLSSSAFPTSDARSAPSGSSPSSRRSRARVATNAAAATAATPAPASAPGARERADSVAQARERASVTLPEHRRQLRRRLGCRSACRPGRRLWRRLGRRSVPARAPARARPGGPGPEARLLPSLRISRRCTTSRGRRSRCEAPRRSPPHRLFPRQIDEAVLLSPSSAAAARRRLPASTGRRHRPRLLRIRTVEPIHSRAPLARP